MGCRREGAGRSFLPVGARFPQVAISPRLQGGSPGAASDSSPPREGSALAWPTLTDCQTRLYMRSRQIHSLAGAARKRGSPSLLSAVAIAKGHAPVDAAAPPACQRVGKRERMLEAAPSGRAPAIFEEISRRHPDVERWAGIETPTYPSAATQKASSVKRGSLVASSNAPVRCLQRQGEYGTPRQSKMDANRKSSFRLGVPVASKPRLLNKRAWHRPVRADSAQLQRNG
jgi:hypothetical protein